MWLTLDIKMKEREIIMIKNRVGPLRSLFCISYSIYSTLLLTQCHTDDSHIIEVGHNQYMMCI